MTQEQRNKLIAEGREDLVRTYDILKSGYAGVNQNGTIVDRRYTAYAIPIPANELFDTPPPKKVK